MHHIHSATCTAQHAQHSMHSTAWHAQDRAGSCLDWVHHRLWTEQTNDWVAAHLAAKEGAQDEGYEGCSPSCERADSTGLSLATSKGDPSRPCILSLGWGLVGDKKRVWPEKRGWLGVLCFSIICKLACITKYSVTTHICHNHLTPLPICALYIWLS